MDLELFVTPGLGDASYLLASGGEAVLVDPQRDAWRFLEVAKRRGWRVRYVLETHVHNDYLSGALETRAAAEAEIAAPARGRYEFEHLAVDEGDAIEIGSLRLTAWATPGHTPEHLAWVVTDLARAIDAAEEPVGVFTGGSLLVGSAGRTDLLGPVLTDALTRDQQRTLHRLASLPDSAQVLPTHGAGSFCSAGPASSNRVSTIAAERLANPTFRLAAAGAAPDVFRAQALDGLGRFPAYYAHMAGLNRRGPRVLGRLILPDALDPAAFEAAADGATVIDARDRESFAAGHLPGSLNIELDGTFAGYVGWLVPFASPVLFVLPDGAADALAEATTELLRIGYEWVRGWLAGGIDAWAASGRPLSSYETTTMEAVHDQRVAGDDASVLLDVRQPMEWESDGVVPGAERIFVADLPARLAELPPDTPVTVFCRSGSRASIAASVLDRAGVEVKLVAHGGASRWPEPLATLADAPA
ncbi:MAG TPA: rhodanese-like domain-containing protein [Candidatus Limnocylindrales bacterium]|jgi:glyoxylase-like metal-dependent hydrolase (beta-lactamase superfamily II)/rhodanese-related sulfurtransferase